MIQPYNSLHEAFFYLENKTKYHGPKFGAYTIITVIINPFWSFHYFDRGWFRIEKKKASAGTA